MFPFTYLYTTIDSDYNFHLNTIKEMLRVTSNEIRIYPLVKNRGKKSDFVKR